MANGNLISGAYAAAGGNIAGYGLGAAAGLMSISDSTAKAISAVVQERNARFQKFADWELGRKEGNIPHHEYEKLRKRLNRRRNQFIWAGKKDREMLMRELQTEKVESDKYNELKKQLANLAKNSETGLSENWMGSDQGESYLNALEGGPTWNEETEEYEYEVLDDDGNKVMISTVDMAAKLKENQRDGATQNLVSTLANGSANGADASLPNDNGIFQYDQNYRNIESQVVGKGNYKSMVNDADILIPGRTFKTDLIEMISNNTYEELGINERNIKDPTPDTPITIEDAAIIADELLKNERLGKKYLTTYVTNHLERNWIDDNYNAGNNENVTNSINQNSQHRPTTTGEPNNEGVYEIPGDKTWDYKMIEGKWHTRKKNTDGNWIDLTKDEKYKSAIEKLDGYFPDAANQETTSSANSIWTDENSDVDLDNLSASQMAGLAEIAEQMGITVEELIEGAKKNKNK
tara:strand:- start:2762 stop:4153 length:1392 start_codon:yes stop_codon:yes gene_type:complete